MTADRIATFVVLLVVASGVPLGRLACQLAPGPSRQHPADVRGTCQPHCTALNEGDR